MKIMFTQTNIVKKYYKPISASSALDNIHGWIVQTSFHCCQTIASPAICYTMAKHWAMSHFMKGKYNIKCKGRL
jgi:hypothetical protein